MRILKDFKSNEFGSADSKGVIGAFCGSADSKEVRAIPGEWTAKLRGAKEGLKHERSWPPDERARGIWGSWRETSGPNDSNELLLNTTKYNTNLVPSQ